MDWINLYPGRRGVLKLSETFATIHLRRLGKIKKEKRKKDYNGRPRAWTEFEYEEAMRMRREGKSPEEICARFRRTEKALTQKLGYSFLRSAA